MSATLLLIGVVFLALVVPAAIRSRRASVRVSVGGFERAMDSLRQPPSGGAGTRAVMVPRDADRLALSPHTAERRDADDTADPHRARLDAGPGRPQPQRSGGKPRPDEPPGDDARVVAVAPPDGEDPLMVRRRATFTRMVTMVGALFVAAVFLRGILWWLFLGAVAVIAGYAVVLRRYKVQRDEARIVVRELQVEGLAPRRRRTEPLAVGGEDFFPPTEPPDAGPKQTASSVRVRRWDA